MQKFFKDKQLADKYLADGYVKIPFTGQTEINRLREIFSTRYGASNNIPNHFFYSLLANSAAENTALKNEIAIILKPNFEKIFEDHQIIAESFLAKPRTTESMLLHQDWSYTDESTNNCATLWLPLQKMSNENGTLFLIKGSHRFFKIYRSGNLPSARIEINDTLKKHITSIDLNEGDAVFFHPALFHGSFPNQTDSLRIITASLVLPKDKVISYFHQNDNETISEYSVSEQDYFSSIQNLTSGLKPIAEKMVRSLNYRHEVPTESRLLTMIVSKNSSTKH